MGYTDPFASSTGLNFLLTVLDSIAEGDPDRLTSPDVASVFEQFQRQVPFVALTTLQMRDSVENDTGTLDTFVMEWQTYTNTESLQSGYEFIPFGSRHDNPLYGVGELTPAQLEALESFATFAEQPEYQESPPSSGSTRRRSSRRSRCRPGATLIEVQNVWKDKKDGGRPVATVFVVDVSGSMEGTRIQAVQHGDAVGARVHQARDPGGCRGVQRHGDASGWTSPSSISTSRVSSRRSARTSRRVVARPCTTASCSGCRCWRTSGRLNPDAEADPRRAQRRGDDRRAAVRRRRRRDRGPAHPDLHRGVRGEHRRARLGSLRWSRLRTSMRARKTSSSRSPHSSTPAAEREGACDLARGGRRQCSAGTPS